MISSALDLKVLIIIFFLSSTLLYTCILLLIFLASPKQFIANIGSQLILNLSNLLYNNIVDVFVSWGFLSNNYLNIKDLKNKKLTNWCLFKYLISQYKKIYILNYGLVTGKLRTFFLSYSNDSFYNFFFTSYDPLNFLFSLIGQHNFNINNFKHHSMYYKAWQDFDLPYHGYFIFVETFRGNFRNVNSFGLEMFLVYTNAPYKNSYQTFFYILPIYSLFKTTFLSLVVTVFFFFNLISYYYINICKQVAAWLIVGFLFFWLISGFNFFLKNSYFGKFTSALARFWKRTNVYFWLVEGFLFSIFFYYYLNSSQEPAYMYDYAGLGQSYLPNIYLTYCNNFILVSIIVYLYFWLLSLSGFTNQQNIFHSFFVTLVILYIYITESYQFYYVLTIFFENIWVYNHETNLWLLEFESPRLRLKQQYLVLALIAKYWHFIFIFLSWVFFVLKLFEQKRTQYTHTGFNLQNLIILFWLNFLFIVIWGKWVSRRFLDGIYYWFFTDSNFHYVKYFFQEFIIKVCR